jgi:glycosyltransferase involved in cell wall biosynthesis
MPTNNPISLSVLVLTRDSADTLETCLASLQFADHVLVLDSGSQDATEAIARRWGADFVTRPWRGFTQQRNDALALCRHPWVLVVDSDEAVSEALAQELGALFRDGQAHAGYRIPERVRFHRRWLRWGGIYPGHHLTLFDRRRGRFAAAGPDVHEGAQVDGSIGTLNGFKFHYAYPSFRLALEKLNRYTDLEAQGRAAAGEKASVYGLTWRPLERFVKNYFLKLGLLDGLEGFLYCSLTALYAFSIQAKLHGLERGVRPVPVPGAADPAGPGGAAVPTAAAL